MNKEFRPPQCIITGADLRFMWMSDKCYFGDLHIAGDQFVFVANTDSAGRPVIYEHKEKVGKGLLLSREAAVLERHGVFVMPANPDWLNVQARAYIGPELIAELEA